MRSTEVDITGKVSSHEAADQRVLDGGQPVVHETRLRGGVVRVDVVVVVLGDAEPGAEREPQIVEDLDPAPRGVRLVEVDLAGLREIRPAGRDPLAAPGVPA